MLPQYGPPRKQDVTHKLCGNPALHGHFDAYCHSYWHISRDVDGNMIVTPPEDGADVDAEGHEEMLLHTRGQLDVELQTPLPAAPVDLPAHNSIDGAPQDRFLDASGRRRRHGKGPAIGDESQNVSDAENDADFNYRMRLAMLESLQNTRDVPARNQHEASGSGLRACDRY